MLEGRIQRYSLTKKGTKVKTDISDRKDDRIKAIRNLEKILAEDDENMYCDYCDM